MTKTTPCPPGKIRVDILKNWNWESGALDKYISDAVVEGFQNSFRDDPPDVYLASEKAGDIGVLLSAISEGQSWRGDILVMVGDLIDAHCGGDGTFETFDPDDAKILDDWAVIMAYAAHSLKTRTMPTKAKMKTWAKKAAEK